MFRKGGGKVSKITEEKLESYFALFGGIANLLDIIQKTQKLLMTAQIEAQELHDELIKNKKEKSINSSIEKVYFEYVKKVQTKIEKQFIEYNYEFKKILLEHNDMENQFGQIIDEKALNHYDEINKLKLRIEEFNLMHAFREGFTLGIYPK